MGNLISSFHINLQGFEDAQCSCYRVLAVEVTNHFDLPPRYSNCDKSVPQTGSAYVTYLARPYFKFVMMITMMMVVMNVMLVMMVVTMIILIMTLVIMVIMNIMRVGQPRQSNIA